jgi:uncharacterized protein YkwD
VVAKRAVVAAVLVALVAAPVALARRGTSGETSVQALNSAVFSQINSIRVAHGLVPLKSNPSLAAAATGHSLEMLDDGYFAHTSYDGSPFWKRLNGYSNGAVHGYWSVGENLLWSSPDIDAGKALQMWMASPEHRDNILTARWREIGISAIHADSANGTFGGHPVTVITTDFGVRR